MVKLNPGYRIPSCKCTSTSELACPGPHNAEHTTAQQVWNALAPLLAGRPTMRVSRDGGRTYRDRWVRPLTSELPSQPAALHLYDDAGHTRLLVLDLDTGRGDVATAYTQITAELLQRGLWHFSDHSPSGGRHIYIPLDRPRPHHEVYGLARALAARWPVIDPQPHASTLTGCITPPGSPHKTGGWRRLTSDLKDAIAAAAIGNLTPVIEDLLAAYPVPADPGAPELPDTIDDLTPWLPAGTRALSPRLTEIARTGRYPTDRYQSPSEARQAVVTGAARAGLTLTDVIRRIDRGIWPGLASMYARYTTGWRTAVVRDWRKAAAFLTHNTSAGDTHVQIGSTSPQVTGGPPPLPTPDVHAQLRTLEAHLARIEVHRWPGQAGRSKRLLLRALLAAAHQDGSVTLARGTRSLSVATGIPHTKIGAHLADLCGEASPLIRHVEPARGPRAAVYELLPPQSEDRTPWRHGKPVHALRPVFRELGTSAAFVYEHLELHGPATVLALSRALGMSRTTITDALETMAMWGLVRADASTWSITTPQALQDAAEQLGALTALVRLVQRFREHRRLWWAWLAMRAAMHQAEHLDHIDLPPPDPLPYPAHAAAG